MAIIRRRRQTPAMVARRKMRARRLVRYKARKYGFAPSVHKIKEKCALPAQNIQLPANTSGGGVITFALSDLLNVSALTNLYDLYKIVGVKLTIIPTYNFQSLGQTIGGTGAGPLPNLFIAPNRDYLTPAPTGVNDILNDDGVKILRPTRPVSFYLRQPKALITDATEAKNLLPFQFDVKTQPWLSTGGNSQPVDQSTLKHYGFRWWVDNDFGGNVTMKVYATYYCIFKEQD